MNPYTGAIYLAFNGPSYPGYGPNIIKEFRPDTNDSVDDLNDGEVDVLVYPVPATDVVNVEISEELIGGEYTVINYRGKTVIEGRMLNSKEVLNVSSLSKGSYYILLQNNGISITRTFTIQ